MPNLDPWVNQNNNDYEDMTTKTINKFENHLLSIRAELQKMIHPKDCSYGCNTKIYSIKTSVIQKDHRLYYC